MKKNIANTLITSFGYTPLNEYSLKQFGQDAGDFGRGAISGATFNFDDEVAAGAKSLYKGTNYADELTAYQADEAKAKARNPGAFTAGELAGGVASTYLMPEVGLIKGAAAATKLGKAANFTTNVAANQATLAAADELHGALAPTQAKPPVKPGTTSSTKHTPQVSAKTVPRTMNNMSTVRESLTVAEQIRSLAGLLEDIDNGGIANKIAAHEPSFGQLSAKPTTAPQSQQPAQSTGEYADLEKRLITMIRQLETADNDALRNEVEQMANKIQAKLPTSM